MKTTFNFFSKTAAYQLLIVLLIFYGCKQKHTIEKPLSATCYRAIDGKDTAYLTLDSLKSNKLKGNLIINYIEKPDNNGSFEGSFTNDTLFVDYTFSVDGKKDLVYKNPLAFLKKDKELILGVGVINRLLGRNYLDKKYPIDFNKGRFIFYPIACK